jgi:hypothetical protein
VRGKEKRREGRERFLILMKIKYGEKDFFPDGKREDILKEYRSESSHL